MSKENEQEIDELKSTLEEMAKESGVRVKGKVANLKTPEQKKAEKEIQAWKEHKAEFELLDEFKVPYELLKCLFNTEQYHGFLMLGEGGLGKTILTLTAVKQNFKPDEWEYSSGYTTPLSLFEYLYENRNKKVIILDDVEGVFNNHISLSILKGALWESDGKRICQYSSKSDKAKMPSKFVMNAKIIVLCNHIPKSNDVSTRATLSRVLNYKLAIEFEDKMRICKRFIEKENLSEDERERVLNILEKRVTKATRDFNFRTLKKLIAFVKYDNKKADKLFRATTEIDEDKQVYLEVIKERSIVKEQVKLFRERTGKSRRTFFRIKKQVTK